MNKPNVGNAFYSLPPWAKGAIAVGVLAGAAYVLHKVATAPKNLKLTQGNREQTNQELKEEQQIKEQGKKATMTKSQMSSAANVIFNAMDGYGTDEDAIMRQMRKIKNDLDYLGVSNAFGTREVSSGKWNPEPNFKGRLAGALQNDLSDYWINLINKHLRSKGVKYKV
jgi:hypothetical protein